MKVRPSVFSFLDAVEFLAQAYAFEKERNSIFSHRYISRIMGARSSSFFKDVLGRKIKLSPARTLGFIRLFKLEKQEGEYFQNLVFFNQAETPDDKNHYLDKLASFSAKRKATLAHAIQAEYFKKWHFAAIREVFSYFRFRGDYAALGAALEPPISENEAMEAVHLLLRVGLLRKNAQGELKKTEKVVSSGTGSPSELVKPAIRENLDLACRALDYFPAELRPFSYLTLSVSEETFGQISERLRTFRREVLDMVTADSQVDRLYQLNLQFFPLSSLEKLGNPKIRGRGKIRDSE